MAPYPNQLGGELTIVAMSVIPGTPQSFENSTRVRDAQGLEYLEACLAEGLFESRLLFRR